MRASFASTLAAVACLLAVPCASAAAPEPAIALADQPLRIIRGAQVYKAVNGALVEPHDIVETGAGGGQIDIGADSIVALGPQTRLYVGSLGLERNKPAGLALLQGWIKVLAPAGARTTVASPAMLFSIGKGAAVLHSEAGKAEMFTEENEQWVAAVDDKGKAAAAVKVPLEQFAAAEAGKPLLIAARPSRQFLAAMPVAFRDRLALALPSAKGARPALVREREAEFADVAPWLGTSMAVKKTFVKRFRGRLADPAFRSQLEQALGRDSDWQAALASPVSGAPPTR